MNPNSKLWLCKTNLENDYKNTLTFSTRNDQRNYFIGNPLDPTSYGVSTKNYTEYTYLRIENAIKVDDFIESIDTNNYLVLLNNNKYYYYFITSMDYIDEQTTKIHIELDVMQTYFFDIEYKQTFVEREHVTDDTAGKHTIPEGLETGEYIGGDTHYFADEDNMNSYIIFQVTYFGDLPTGDTYSMYGGVFSGCIFMAMDATNAVKFIKHMNNYALDKYIVNIFMYFGTLELSSDYTLPDAFTGNVTFKVVNYTTLSKLDNNLTLMTAKPTTIGTYTPRNKKLLTGDYQYLLANNQGGTAKQYTFEDFSTSTITFSRYSNVCVGGSIAYYPQSYKEATTNFNEGFMGAKFPTCCWTTDGYINWLTESGINQKTSEAKTNNLGSSLIKFGVAAGATGLGVLTANPMLIGMGVSSMTSTAVGGFSENSKIQKEAMEAKRQHQIAPLEINGFTGGGDVMYGINRCCPKFTVMHIKEEYAKIIDKFFDQFGYQVNILKSPSIHTRTNWNYLKTRSCNFTGNIPQEYMERIKKIFDNGITFWHKPSKMLDYTQTNNVIS